MSIVYDAAVLVAADRGDRTIWNDHQTRLERDLLPTVTATVVAQVSRSGRQALLRRFLHGCVSVTFSNEDAHEVGELLSAAGTSDVVDAHVMLVASRSGLAVLTADVKDMERLSAHLPSQVVVRRV